MRQGFLAKNKHSTTKIMSKPKILFITAPIRSHLIPSFYIANLLSANYAVVYAVEDDILEELVQSQGFETTNYSKYKVETDEKRKTLTEFVLDSFNITSFKNQNVMFKKLIDDVSPSVIVMDIFRGSNFYSLHHFLSDFKVFFFSPMVSTYRVEGFLTVAGKNWDKEDINKPRFLKSPRQYFFHKLNAYKKNKILKTCTSEFRRNLSSKSTFTPLFEHQIEFVLAPLEFEYAPEVKRVNQVYLGLSTSKKRVDTELDARFEAKFSNIIKKREAGEKIIYCSFGTFYKGSNVPILNFYKNLIDAVKEIPNIQVICSINDIIVQTLEYKREIPTNIHFFSRTPQLKVLENTDIFINHGGFGSVKESIEYSVPMLVYPLDMTYDMYGNSLKVVHHKIGIAGNLKSEQPNHLKENILAMLTDNSYKKNIVRMNKAISQNYDFVKQRALLQDLITN